MIVCKNETGREKERKERKKERNRKKKKIEENCAVIVIEIAANKILMPISNTNRIKSVFFFLSFLSFFLSLFILP
jgi:hypothetical protein